MADLQIRFPPLISFGAVGGPRFKTSAAVMASGAESRTQEWELERGEWTVSHSARLPQDWKPLLSFFRNVAGMANTFRFKDWTDFECDAGDGFFAANLVGSPTVLQMIKRYSFPTISGGSVTYDRYISKPINGTVTIVGGGTLDYETGLITGGSPTSWHGQFDCWARLNNDPMRAQVLDRNLEHGLIVGWEGIEIVEVRDEAV